jgi:hypothetical protein
MVGENEAVRHPARVGERGSSLVEASLVALFILIPLLCGVINYGRAYFYSIEVVNAAKAGAQFGAQGTGLTATGITGMQTAAKNEAPDIVVSCTGQPGACWAGGSPLATWGCECSGTNTPGGGTNSCPLLQSSCPVHLVYFVYVTTAASYTPFLNFLGLFPSMTLRGQAKIRLASQ